MADDWNWFWPYVGGSPVTEGVESEMFDRTDYPYSDTFVREAIQNSLDARREQNDPVVISFRFHSAPLGPQKPFLQEAFGYRRMAGLPVPPAWDEGRIEWITIEDTNAKGLAGALDDRLGDFWNYWLNFGISNKDGSGRGGRGIGRITFLIASQVRTVLGYTRRMADNRTAACGMCILKARPDGKRLRSTHSYLARREVDSIYDLHDSNEFLEGLRTAFGLTGYSNPKADSGLALVIPYPHEELAPDGILASAIEHFSPAIMNRLLVVKVNDVVLDDASISDVAQKVSASIRTEAIRTDVNRYLDLIRAGLQGSTVTLAVTELRKGVNSIRGSAEAGALREELAAGKTVSMKVELPLKRNGAISTVSLTAVASSLPQGKIAIDRLFREGMSLPDVKAKVPGNLDLVLLADDPALATYLNFCEGKAHLDLLGSKEVRAKLAEKGYDGISVKNFIKNLPTDLRSMLTPEITEPDLNVFADIFGIPDETKSGTMPGKRKGPSDPPPPPPPPPPPKVQPFLVETLSDGFRIRANPKFENWPVGISVAVAYADGSRSPTWSPEDFTRSDLTLTPTACDLKMEKNRVEASNFGADAAFEVRGFNPNLELDTRIREVKHAQAN